MLSALLLFALAASSPAKDPPCPPAGFRNVEYVSGDVAATLARELERQLAAKGDHGWGGPARMEGRPAAVDLDLYVKPDGSSASACVLSGERHVVAQVLGDLVPVKLNAPHEPLVVPLTIKLIWHSGRAGQDLREFVMYELKVEAAQRP